MVQGERVSIRVVLIGQIHRKSVDSEKEARPHREAWMRGEHSFQAVPYWAREGPGQEAGSRPE